MTRALSLWAPVALSMAVIFHASSGADVSLPEGFDDKPAHSLAYTVLGGLIVRALAGGLGARVGASIALLGIVLATAYGIALEILQLFVPGRYAEWADVGANVIGASLGALVCWLCGIIRPASRHGL